MFFPIDKFRQKIAIEKFNIYTLFYCVFYIVATSGEEGRKSLMRDIDLGKLLGGKPQPNIVEFIGCTCVTTQGNCCNCGNFFVRDLRCKVVLFYEE